VACTELNTSANGVKSFHDDLLQDIDDFLLLAGLKRGGSPRHETKVENSNENVMGFFFFTSGK